MQTEVCGSCEQAESLVAAGLKGNHRGTTVSMLHRMCEAMLGPACPCPHRVWSIGTRQWESERAWD